ncbi:MAG: ABC transporter ATP-binding protein [Bacillota bacterium]|nr:ABC transporter ATP-binding protein [Bacillota bacterium]
MTALKLEHVTKKYKGFTLKDISLKLPKGCIRGLRGENGAGKSTTMKLILDIAKADSGNIEVLGQSHIESLKSLKEEIGVVLDEAYFPQSFTAQNVNSMLKRFYRNWDEEVFFNYLKVFSLPSDKVFKEFSRGMKMKLSISAALSHKAKLLILDEPTGGLDPMTRDEFVDILYEYTRDENNSVLISSHIISDLEKLCDYIAFIHKGELLFCEEKDILREKFAIWRGDQEAFAAIDPKAVQGMRKSPYGVEALVERDMVPLNWELEIPGIEDITIFIAKEGKNI